MAVTARQITSNALGLVGALAGGVLGYYTFQWIYYHGFYGMMIPGALLGLGCGLVSQHSSHFRGLICAAAALGLGLYTEWSFFPFVADKSFTYFLKHVPDLSPVSLVMIAAGAFFAFWLGKDAGFRLLPGRQARGIPDQKADSNASH